MLQKKSSQEGNNIDETVDTHTNENGEVNPDADATSDKHTKLSVENKHNDSEVPTNGGSDPGTPNPTKGIVQKFEDGCLDLIC